jgi:hypothetical protein
MPNLTRELMRPAVIRTRGMMTTMVRVVGARKFIGKGVGYVADERETGWKKRKRSDLRQGDKEVGQPW